MFLNDQSVAYVIRNYIETKNMKSKEWNRNQQCFRALIEIVYCIQYVLHFFLSLFVILFNFVRVFFFFWFSFVKWKTIAHIFSSNHVILFASEYWIDVLIIIRLRKVSGQMNWKKKSLSKMIVKMYIRMKKNLSCKFDPFEAILRSFYLNIYSVCV